MSNEKCDPGKARVEIHRAIQTGPITMTVMVDLMMSAYARGRREAIWDAAQLLRGPYPELSRLTAGEDFASIRERCAASIERHEASLTAGKGDVSRS